MEPKPSELLPPTSETSRSTITIGRYVLHARIARGGMATIHIARLTGVEGFSRIVAVKRLHPEFIEDAEFVSMFLDEARIASKVHHPNVVPVLDIVSTGTEIMLVQEYIHGVPFNVLLQMARKRGQPVSVPIVAAIMVGVLGGLHGAHEARDELGQPMQIVHRDVSPQNVMIAVDGTPRLLDFGVAKATLSAHVTRQGTFKGKIAYTAPEQLMGVVTRRSDIYAAGVMMWEALVGRRLHQGVPESVVLSNVVHGVLPTVTEALRDGRASIPQDRWDALVALEPVVARAMALDPDKRFATAADFATAIRDVVPPVLDEEVAVWARELGREFLEGRERVIAGEETSWRRAVAGPDSGPTGESSFSSPSQRSGVESVKPRHGPGPPQDSRPSRQVLFIALLLVLLGVAGASVVFLLMRSPSVAPAGVAAPAPPASVTAPVVVAPSPPSALPATPDSAASARSDSRPSTSPPPYLAHPAPYVPPPRPPPAAPPAAVAPAPPAAQPAAPAAPDCNPPFYFSGTKKIYKPGCI